MAVFSPKEGLRYVLHHCGLLYVIRQGALIGIRQGEHSGTQQGALIGVRQGSGASTHFSYWNTYWYMMMNETAPCDLDGTRVDVYKNLHDDCISIKSAEPTGTGSTAETQGVSESRDTDSDEYGTVVGHTQFALLEDVSFVIQESGQQRARESGTKNVHAVVRGTVDALGYDAEVEWSMMSGMFDNDVANVRYDPFEMDAFTIEEPVRMKRNSFESGDTVEKALYASVTTDGVGAMFRAPEDR